MERSETFEAPEFSAVWPELSQRLRRVLHARRVPADLVDDIVQETGLRLFRNWSKVDQATVWALANTVLLNIVRDEVRKNEVRKRDARLLIAETARNLDDEMLNHLELRRVERVIRKLSDVDQQVLLAEWGVSSDETFVSPAALKMARMRARRRLRAALGNASALVPGWWRFRRAMFSKNASLWNVSEQLSHIAVASALAIAGIAGSFAAAPQPGAGRGVGSTTSSDHLVAAVVTPADGLMTRDVLESQGWSPGSPLLRSDDDAARPTSKGTHEAGLNENFGPVRNDDGDVHIGEGGNGLGPYGAGHTVETAPAGRKTKARVHAEQEAPTCDGDLVVGGTVGESEPECEPGEGSAGVETEAEGEEHEAGTP